MASRVCRTPIPLRRPPLRDTAHKCAESRSPPIGEVGATTCTNTTAHCGSNWQIGFLSVILRLHLGRIQHFLFRLLEIKAIAGYLRQDALRYREDGRTVRRLFVDHRLGQTVEQLFIIKEH